MAAWLHPFRFFPRLLADTSASGKPPRPTGAGSGPAVVRFPLPALLPEACYLSGVSKLELAWFQGTNLVKRYLFPETLEDALLFSYFYTSSSFDGNESAKRNRDSDSLYVRAPHRLRWTNILLATNVLIHVAQMATGGKLLLLGAKVNSLIDRGQIWRLATASFLHANVAHLLVNCVSLNSIGSTVELASGPTRFLAVYFASALASTLMSYRFCESPAVGASGAIFGLIGSHAMFTWRHRALLGGRKEMQQIATVIALNLAIGLSFRRIDNWGHLGGLLAGLATSWFLGPCWQYQYHSKDGKAVFADMAPVRRIL